MSDRCVGELAVVVPADSIRQRGLVANIVCMAFYLIGPFMGFGTAKEPLLALGLRSANGAAWDRRRSR